MTKPNQTPEIIDHAAEQIIPDATHLVVHCKNIKQHVKKLIEIINTLPPVFVKEVVASVF
jgi:hypothetical protein